MLSSPWSLSFREGALPHPLLTLRMPNQACDSCDHSTDTKVCHRDSAPRRFPPSKGMSAATALIGCIPRGPWGSYLLLSLKVLQGLFVSGEGPAAVVYSIERSRPVRIANFPWAPSSIFSGPSCCRLLGLTCKHIGTTEHQQHSFAAPSQHQRCF